MAFPGKNPELNATKTKERSRVRWDEEDLYKMIALLIRMFKKNKLKISNLRGFLMKRTTVGKKTASTAAATATGTS